jgi:hypothetical protein
MAGMPFRDVLPLKPLTVIYASARSNAPEAA